MPVVLAHGGGIPEALMVLVPLALVVVMLRMGAKKMPPEEPAPDGDPDGGPDDAADGGPPDPALPPD